MALDPVTALLDIGGKILDKVFPDPVQRDAAKLELLKMQQNGELAELAAETDLAKGQMAINQVEAASANVFVSGWRPFAGWVCCVAFAYSTLILPIIVCVLTIKGINVVLPQLNTSLLETVFLGMLGLRGVEKMGDKGHLPWQK